MGTEISNREEADWLYMLTICIPIFFFSFQSVPQSVLHLVIISCLCFLLKVVRAICFNRKKKKIIPTFFFSAQ